jgi:hypothetical protein
MPAREIVGLTVPNVTTAEAFREGTAKEVAVTVTCVPPEAAAGGV